MDYHDHAFCMAYKARILSGMPMLENPTALALALWATLGHPGPPWAPEPLLPAFLRQEALGCRQAGTGELVPQGQGQKPGALFALFCEAKIAGIHGCSSKNIENTCLHGCMDGCMHGFMDVWMHIYIYVCIYMHTH